MHKSKIDDTAYEAGKKFFTEGKSLRELVEPIVNETADSEVEENQQVSALLGFFDAFLDQVRAPY